VDWLRRTAVDDRQAEREPRTQGADDCRSCGPADGSWKGTGASGDSKRVDEGMSAVRSVTWAHVNNTPVRAEKRAVSSLSTCRCYCEVRWAAERVGRGARSDAEYRILEDPLVSL
jgi:hypothetical protein